MAQELKIGDWIVEPALNTLRREGRVAKVEPKTMQVLLFLASHPGEVLSRDRIIEEVWPDAFVTDGVLWNRISELRQAFEEDPQNPKFIETVPKSGYRLVAKVTMLTEKASVQKKHYGAWAGVFVLVSIVAAVFFWWIGFWGQGTPLHLPPDQRITVLITDFENRTGEPLLNGTLEFVLEQELAGSKLLQTASRDRIEETLALMKKPSESSIDRMLGREISLRDGGIEAVLAGRIVKLGSRYQLALLVVDPDSDQVLASGSREVEAQEQILAAVRELSRWVRDEMGEQLEQHDSKSGGLERVTTQSLEALSLYSKGVRAYRSTGDSNRYLKAETFLRQAIEMDPEFASAYLLLAWALRYQGRQEEAMKVIKEAVEHADTTSVTERAFILGCFHDWLGENELASAQYEILFDLQPDHYWVTNNLLRVYQSLGRPVEAVNLVTRYADLRPDSLRAQGMAASVLIESLGDLEAARPFVRRIREILASDLANYSLGGWVLPFDSWEHWLAGDVEAALGEADTVYHELLGKKEQGLDLVRPARFLGAAYLALGKLSLVEEICSDFGNIPFLPAALALVRKEPEKLKPYPKLQGRTRMWLIILQLDPTAVEQLEVMAPADLIPGREEILGAQVAMARGHYSQAISGFNEGIDAIQIHSRWPHVYVLLASMQLAEAWVRVGNLEEAVGVLEKASLWKERTYPESAALWLMIRARLAQLYREVGRDQEAHETEAELRQLLSLADKDHPILVQLAKAVEDS